MGHFFRHLLEIYSAIIAVPSFLLGAWVSHLTGKVRRRRVAMRHADHLDRVVNDQ